MTRLGARLAHREGPVDVALHGKEEVSAGVGTHDATHQRPGGRGLGVGLTPSTSVDTRTRGSKGSAGVSQGKER